MLQKEVRLTFYYYTYFLFACYMADIATDLVPTIAETTDHELTWSRVRHWMAICRSTSDREVSQRHRQRHVQCHKATAPDSFPARLIYIPDEKS